MERKNEAKCQYIYLQLKLNKKKEERNKIHCTIKNTTRRRKSELYYKKRVVPSSNMEKRRFLN
jgi:hypothetical protein